MNRNLLKLLGLLVVVLIIGVFVYKFTQKINNGPQNNAQNGQQAQNVLQAGKRVDASKGQLVQGFPQDLVLNNFGPYGQSYEIPYGSSTQQMTVNFQTKTKVSDEYNQYLSLLTKDGYTIINKNLSTNTANIYAHNNSGDVNFSITHTSGQAVNDVSLTYLKK